MRSTPLADRMLAVCCLAMVANGLLLSLPEALGVPVAPDGPWPPLRALHHWAVTQEPAHLDPPPTLRASLWFDALVQTPVAALLGMAFWRGHARRWRTIGLVYGGAAVANMYFYFFQTVMGPHPPLDPIVYWPMNLPWLLVPVVIVVRLARDTAPNATVHRRA